MMFCQFWYSISPANLERFTCALVYQRGSAKDLRVPFDRTSFDWQLPNSRCRAAGSIKAVVHCLGLRSMRSAAIPSLA